MTAGSLFFLLGWVMAIIGFEKLYTFCTVTVVNEGSFCFCFCFCSLCLFLSGTQPLAIYLSTVYLINSKKDRIDHRLLSFFCLFLLKREGG